MIDITSSSITSSSIRGINTNGCRNTRSTHITNLSSNSPSIINSGGVSSRLTLNTNHTYSNNGNRAHAVTNRKTTPAATILISIQPI